jgi:hypothetical protein
MKSGYVPESTSQFRDLQINFTGRGYFKSGEALIYGNGQNIFFLPVFLAIIRLKLLTSGCVPDVAGYLTNNGCRTAVFKEQVTGTYPKMPESLPRPDLPHNYIIRR